MSVILILIFAGILVAGGFLLAFIWAVKSGQMDDSYTPAVRILFEEQQTTSENNSENNINRKADKLK